MLPHKHRIPSSELSSIMRFGKRVQTPGLSMVYRVLTISHSRFAFVVSTKIDKRATGRNRMRRLMSESVRLHTQEIKPGIDGVFIAKKGLMGLSQVEVEAQVMEGLKRAGILNAE